jgi:hypothetical protein
MAIKSGFQKSLPGFLAAPMLTGSQLPLRLHLPAESLSGKPPFYSGRYQIPEPLLPSHSRPARETRRRHAGRGIRLCPGHRHQSAVKHWVRNVETRRAVFLLAAYGDRLFLPGFRCRVERWARAGGGVQGRAPAQRGNPRKGADRAAVGNVERRTMPVSDGRGGRSRAGRCDTDRRQNRRSGTLIANSQCRLSDFAKQIQPSMLSRPSIPTR